MTMIATECAEDTSLESIDVSQASLFETDEHLEYFARLRREDPVHFCKKSDFGPFWSITKFHDIVAVDSNHEAFSSEGTILIGDNPEDFNTPMFIAMDPPRHDQQRKAATPAVAPRRLSELESLIRQRVCTILDGLPRNEEFNWVERVSVELTTQMLATLFDVPFEDRHLLPYWSDVVTSTDQVGNADRTPEERQRILAEETLPYFMKLWHERANGEPRFDLISLMAQNPDTRDMHKDPMELLGNLMLLIVGGNDTTRNSISGSVYGLNRFPAEYEKLRADHSLISNMVSEVIRWQTPLSHMRRNATRDIELGGKMIRKGDKVILWYVSGNRDEDVIDNPDQLIIDRDRARHHVSFGFGIHRCMGNRVAEMQIRILWEEIMKRFDNIEVVKEPVRVSSNFVRGYEELMVRIPE